MENEQIVEEKKTDAPVLEKKEGYWFSPFTDRAALLRTINDIGKQRIPVMLDAE